MRNDENKVAMDYLKGIIAENQELKEKYCIAYDCWKYALECLQELQKNASVSPPVYKFMIN